MLPPHLAAAAAAELGATLVDAAQYEAHRIALGVPRGGLDFSYGDAFPHETDMDQLGGVDFDKGCYVGQEVVSRMEHRGTRAQPRRCRCAYDGVAPAAGAAVTAGDKQVGTHGLRRGRPRGLRCCGSTASAEALAARRRRSSAAACRSIWSSRTGRASPFRAKPKPPNDERMKAPVHADGLARCPWPKDDPLYVAYHDQEWGVPEYDDRALYEKLMLDGFQAGLSWITILRKRDNFRRAFDGFVPEKIARYRPAKVERLMQDAGIVRNRAKIEGAVRSARAWLEIMDKGPGFSKLLWDFVDGKPKVNHYKTQQARCRPRPRSRARSPRSWRSAASNSAGRPSSTPSCRRSAWSTIIW